MVPVILSGGSGVRACPLSGDASPKQLRPLMGDDSMLQSTWKMVPLELIVQSGLNLDEGDIVGFEDVYGHG